MQRGIFVTGGAGLLGVNWALARRNRTVVTLGLHERSIRLRGVETRSVDLGAVEDIRRALDELQPQLVVHSAGITSVEHCEADPVLASHTNVQLAVNVAAACRLSTVPLVHMSTDHLFAGDEPFVSEHQPARPLNEYGRTKAAAERCVLDAYPDCLVVRTNFYGWGPPYRPSFSDRIVRPLRRSEPVTLFDDVFYTPILAESLCDAVHDLVDRKTHGIVHVVGDERISKFEFGLKVARHLHLDPDLIRAGSLHQERTLVRRPLDMSLSNGRATQLLGRALGGVDDHLRRLVEQEQLGLADELQEL